MSKRLIPCVAGFAALCIAAVVFLHTFMNMPDPMQYLEFDSVFRLDEDGSPTPALLDEYGRPAGMEDGAVYRFHGVAENIPGTAYLRLEIMGAGITIRIDGETMFQSAGTGSYDIATATLGVVHVPFPQGVERCEVEVDYQVLNVENAFYPPLVYYTSSLLLESSNMAFANLYGIPAGCFMTVFVAICGLFLLGVARGRPDYTLILPALAAVLLSVHGMICNCGYYFGIPDWLIGIFVRDAVRLLPLLLLLVWLLLGRRRGTWRLLGWSSLITGAAVLCVYLASLARGGYIAEYVNDMFQKMLFYGNFADFLYWLTMFLVPVSAGIAAYGVLRSFIRMEADTQTMALQNELTLANYRTVEEKLQETSALRHEWKNYVAALHLLQQKGDLDELGRCLERLDNQLDRLAPRQYTEHLAINTILQNAAARAEPLGTVFRATAPVPAGLGVSEADLCSLLLNMLDNALEAASKVPPPDLREVECTLQVRQGYLAIKCENTYCGPLCVDEDGQLRTTKPDQSGHGFGLSQMRSIAKKHHSVLDISYTDSRFVVQTALKLQ